MEKGDLEPHWVKRFHYTKFDFTSWQFAILYRNPFAIIRARMVWLCGGLGLRIVRRTTKADLD